MTTNSFSDATYTRRSDSVDTMIGKLLQGSFLEFTASVAVAEVREGLPGLQYGVQSRDCDVTRNWILVANHFPARVRTTPDMGKKT